MPGMFAECAGAIACSIYLQASPLGKRDRPIEATFDLTICDAASSSSSSPIDSSNDDHSQPAAVRRLRLNGTTPVVVAKHKAVSYSSFSGAGKAVAGLDADVECLLDD